MLAANYESATRSRSSTQPEAFGWTSGGKYLTVGNPIKLSDSPADVRRSPLLGEHTEEILRTVLGLSEGDIQAAREQKAI